VRYQLEDSGARAVICQDALYEKVAKAGVVIDLLVVTNVGEYLPAFKRLFSRKMRNSSPGASAAGLLKRYPPAASRHRASTRKPISPRATSAATRL